MNEEVELRRSDKRRARREQRRRLRTEGIDSYAVTAFERRPLMLLHALLLFGLFEPYLYPSLPPLLALMTKAGNASPGVEAHARDAFNFTWFYSMSYALVTVVTLAAGQSQDIYDLTVWHAPVLIVFGVLVIRAISRISKDKTHHYPLHFRLVRANNERSFMGRS